MVFKAARTQESSGAQATDLPKGDCRSLGPQPPRPSHQGWLMRWKVEPSSCTLPRPPEEAGKTLNFAHLQSASTYSHP